MKIIGFVLTAALAMVIPIGIVSVYENQGSLFEQVEAQELMGEVDDIQYFVPEKDPVKVMQDSAIAIQAKLDEQRAKEEAEKKAAEEAAAAQAAAEQATAEQAEQEQTYYDTSYDDSYYESDSGWAGATSSYSGGSISGNQFRSAGVIYDDNGTRYTWYSENVLPGGGLNDLNNNGRHVDEEGFIRDADGYLAAASNDYAQGTIIDTPFGQAKIYDRIGPGGDGTVDMYTSW